MVLPLQGGYCESLQMPRTLSEGDRLPPFQGVAGRCVPEGAACYSPTATPWAVVTSIQVIAKYSNKIIMNDIQFIYQLPDKVNNEARLHLLIFRLRMKKMTKKGLNNGKNDIFANSYHR